jgi:uncharacterized membrane-anchored protein YhcB (DUF1043 family)
MHIAPELLPVIQITLPLIFAIFFASWNQNRYLARLEKELDEIKIELKAIRAELKLHGERIARLEERIPPLVHQ